MNDIQVNKDKATLLQQHLKQDGMTLPRSRALNIIAQLDGYRSHTVAKRGKQHGEKSSTAPVSAVVLYSGSYLHPDVEASYVANQGCHCPYCGSRKVQDANNASADIALWDVQMSCGGCGKGWWATYTLERVDGLDVPETALQYVRDGHSGCALCGAADAHLDYSTFAPGRQGYQTAKCGHCRGICVHVYQLTGMSELMPSDDDTDHPQYVVSDSWSHLFGPGSAETEVCFVYDRTAGRIVAMAAKSGYKWVDCSPAEMADVEDSLKNANSEALEDPESWDMAECDANDLPDWAKDLMNMSA
jgi:hypothetical protein